MTKKTQIDNVFLRVSEYRYDEKPFGTLSPDDIKKLYNTICNIDASANACPTGISAELTHKQHIDKNFLFRQEEKDCDNKLTITLKIIRQDLRCPAQSTKECLKNITSGGCPDEHVKSWFKILYDNNQKQQ